MPGPEPRPEAADLRQVYQSSALNFKKLVAKTGGSTVTLVILVVTAAIFSTLWRPKVTQLGIMSDTGFLETLAPIHDRGARSVFVAGEDRVFPFASAIDQKTTLFIKDSEQLQSLLDEKSGRTNPSHPGVRNGLFARLFGSARLVFSGLEIDLGKALFTPNLSRNLEAYDNYIIYEDGIDRLQFGELFNLFVATPAHRRPVIVVIPKRHGSTLIDNLRYSSDFLQFIDVSKENDRVIHIKRLAPADLNDYLELYSRGVYHAAVRTRLDTLLPAGTPSPESFQCLASQVVELQARLMTEERHLVQPAIEQSLERLKLQPETSAADKRDDWLRLKCYLLLQKTYCSESKEPLEQALAIATTLGTEFDRALCMRFAHLLGVEVSLEQHMLRTAESIFRKHDSQELAFYCANNLCVSAFSSGTKISETLIDLCAEIERRLPTLHRVHDIIYNQGVEVLLDDRLDEAENIFTQLEGSTARPLVKCSAKLALLILARVRNRQIEAAEIAELLSEARRTVDPSNEWHRCNIILNVLVIANDCGLNWRLLYDSFSDTMTLSEDLDVRDPMNENLILASYLGIHHENVEKRMQGRFMSLYVKTNCLLPFYYIWS